MSLIVYVPFEHGCIVVADKRERNQHTKEFWDRCNKIIQLTPSALATCVGATIVTDDETGVYKYCVDEELRKFFQPGSFSEVRLFNGLGASLIESYHDFLVKEGKDELPQVGPRFAMGTLYYYEGTIRFAEHHFIVSRANIETGILEFGADFELKFSGPIRVPYAMGEVATWHEIRRKEETFYAAPIFAQLDRLSPSLPDLNLSIEYARAVLGLTADRCTEVSHDHDLMVLTDDGGIESL